MTVTLSAQSIETEKKSWTFISRLAATSVSDESNPAGYKVYSSITVNAGVRWEFIHPFALEIILNTESREVDNIDPQGHENSLGSIDLIPITLLLQYHPDLAEWIHPYIGVGFNVTRFFEKSGILNPQRLSNSTGMAYQVGVDFDISSYAVCNVDVKSVAMTTNIEADGNNNIRLKINPFTFGIGLGFRL
jgi:outer membrane protein